MWYHKIMKIQKELPKNMINNHKYYSEAQKKQDEIFRKMPAEQKLQVAAGLWKLAKELAGNKVNYDGNRSQTTFN
jgi:hypothetical protein